MTRSRMLREMPAQEFIDWQAFHRQCPFGYDWEDRNIARLVEVIESTKAREGKMPPFKDFLRTRPSPLKHERRKAEAKERRARKNVRRRT
jgi:hypothetical protein